MKSRTFAAIVALLAVVAAAAIVTGVRAVNQREASRTQPDYLAQVFPADEVIEVSIEIDPADWSEMLADPTAERYYVATAHVAGITVHNVGFRIKGNSSLSSVARSDSDRYSFKLDFDQFVAGQNLLGLSKLNLNNNFSDQSSMREYLAYQAFAEMGIPTPATVYTNVSINGQLQGMYLAVEGIEEPFLNRYFGEAAGELYKPEGSGADLAWKGEDPASYPGIISQNKNVQSDNQQLIAFLKALDSGEELEEFLDVDSALRYFAVSTALANFDSYQGQMLHNYYLYNHDGQFVILPWDLNMAFGGFGGGSNVLIDEPTMGALADRPLIATLLAVPEYLARYHGYLQTVASGFLSAERMEVAVRQTDELIYPHIAADPTKFYTLEQYETGLDGENGLLAYADKLSASILQQLSGDLPSTNGGQGSSAGRGGFGGLPAMNPADSQAAPEAGFRPDLPAAGEANPVDRLPAAGGRLNGAGFGLPQGTDMQTVQKILQEAGEGELSVETKEKLLELGLSEEMIERMTSGRGVAAMPNNPVAGAGEAKPGRMGDRVDGAANNNALAERQGAHLLGGLALLMLSTGVVLIRSRRRRFVS